MSSPLLHKAPSFAATGVRRNTAARTLVCVKQGGDVRGASDRGVTLRGALAKGVTLRGASATGGDVEGRLSQGGDVEGRLSQGGDVEGRHSKSASARNIVNIERAHTHTHTHTPGCLPLWPCGVGPS
jgi:hypothetical protein